MTFRWYRLGEVTSYSELMYSLLLIHVINQSSHPLTLPMTYLVLLSSRLFWGFVLQIHVLICFPLQQKSRQVSRFFSAFESVFTPLLFMLPIFYFLFLQIYIFFASSNSFAASIFYLYMCLKCIFLNEILMILFILASRLA